VIAPAETAGHSYWLAGRIGGDNRVHAIGFAGAAVVLDGGSSSGGPDDRHGIDY